MQDKKWMNYISLYSQLIKKVISGGPHRVVIICMLWAHCLDGIFAWLNIAWKASFGGTHLYCLSVIPLVSNYPYQVCLIYWKWRVSLWLPNNYLCLETTRVVATKSMQKPYNFRGISIGDHFSMFKLSYLNHIFGQFSAKISGIPVALLPKTFPGINQRLSLEDGPWLGMEALQIDQSKFPRKHQPLASWCHLWKKQKTKYSVGNGAQTCQLFKI